MVSLLYLLNQNHCCNGPHAVCTCAQESEKLHEPALVIDDLWSSFLSDQSRAFTNAHRVFIVVVATGQTVQGCLKSSECFPSVIYSWMKLYIFGILWSCKQHLHCKSKCFRVDLSDVMAASKNCCRPPVMKCTRRLVLTTTFIWCGNT